MATYIVHPIEKGYSVYMRVVSVIPIALGVNKEELTYFTSKKVAPGDIVTIPLRKREVPAIVTSVEDAEAQKAKIKTADFTTRKIVGVESEPALSKNFVKAAEAIAEYYATTTGAVINTLVPKIVFQTSLPGKQVGQAKKKSNTKKAIEAEYSDRLKYYSKMILENLDTGNSTIVITPTISQSEQLNKGLSESIDKKHIHLIHSGLGKKAAIKSWKAASSSKPGLVIGTVSSISVPRGDIGLVIVEDEGSRYFKKQTRPFVDGRRSAEIFAETIGADLILGGSILSVSTKYRTESGDIEMIPQKGSRESTPEIEIISMKKNGERGNEVKLISDELLELLEKTTSRGENVFVYTARRGLSPTTICGDCGHTVLCKKCSSPVVLHAEKPSNIYICHKCGNTESTKVYCAHCNSWHLKPFGIGIERLEQEITFTTFNTKVFRIDRDSTNTLTEARKQVEAWQRTPGSVLLGTEMALPLLPEIEYSAVGSIDSLFSLPDFMAGEKIFRVIDTIASKTRRRFLIQTRSPEQPVLEFLKSGDRGGFYKKEIEDRRMYNQPPFATFIKLSISGSKSSVLKSAKEVKEALEGYKLQVYSPTTTTVGAGHTINALLELPQDKWVDKELLKSLRTLPQNVSVDVDSVTLF